MYKARFQFDILSAYEATIPKEQGRQFWSSLSVLLHDQRHAEGQQLPELLPIHGSILLTIGALQSKSGGAVTILTVAQQFPAIPQPMLCVYIDRLKDLEIVRFDKNSNLELVKLASVPALSPQSGVTTSSGVVEAKVVAMSSSSSSSVTAATSINIEPTNAMFKKRGNSQITPPEVKNVVDLLASQTRIIQQLQEDNKKLKNKLTEVISSAVGIVEINRNLREDNHQLNNHLKAVQVTRDSLLETNKGLIEIIHLNNTVIQGYENGMSSVPQQPQLPLQPTLQRTQGAFPVTTLPLPQFGPFFRVSAMGSVNNSNNNTGQSFSIGVNNRRQN